MGNVQVWLLAGPIKCNWPSLTLWLVFANPVTYNVLLMFNQAQMLVIIVRNVGCKGAHEGHACDSQFLLCVIFDCLNKNPFYTCHFEGTCKL